MPNSKDTGVHESTDGSNAVNEPRAQDNLSRDDRDDTITISQGNESGFDIRSQKRDGKGKHSMGNESDSDSNTDGELSSSDSSTKSDKSASSSSSNSDSGSDHTDTDRDVRSRRHFDRTKKTRQDFGDRSPIETKGAYSMFDPESDDSKWNLPTDLQSYVDKHFTKYIKDKTLQKNVLKPHPVPSSKSLSAPKVDSYIDHLYQARGASIEKGIDRALSQVQQKLLNAMGPLARIWNNLHEVKSAEASPSLDLDETLTLLDQSVLLVGQANVSLNYQRRVSVLTKLTKDPKRTKSILAKHEDILQKPGTHLFGEKFEKVITKIAKSKKRARELANELGNTNRYTNPQKKRRFFQINTQPFRQGPPRGGQHFGGRITFSSNRKQGPNQPRKNRP
ncbi:uncharacterized protein [Ptychodera flava]|uniref:uncharacterized protein n=1 Tax=Ptychodera flava TaxID=63121 RepID=UPI00396AA9DD